MKSASEIQLTAWLENAAGVPITSLPALVLEMLLLSGRFFSHISYSWSLSSFFARTNSSKPYHSEDNRLKKKKSSATSQKNHNIPYLSIRIQTVHKVNNLNSDDLLREKTVGSSLPLPVHMKPEDQKKTEASTSPIKTTMLLDLSEEVQILSWQQHSLPSDWSRSILSNILDCKKSDFTFSLLIRQRSLWL